MFAINLSILDFKFGLAIFGAIIAITINLSILDFKSPYGLCGQIDGHL